MIVPVSHRDWQVLRHLLRVEAEGRKPLGRELRLYPLRATKDGTFLDALVDEGLIAVAAKPTPPDPGRESEPAQFRARYRLTDKGKHAAEYGEYDRPFAPAANAPLSGLAAEVLGVGPASEAGTRGYQTGRAAPTPDGKPGAKPRAKARKAKK